MPSCLSKSAPPNTTQTQMKDDQKRVYAQLFFDELFEPYWIEWNYFRTWTRKRSKMMEKFGSVDELVKVIDMVPEEIIGRFNTNQAYSRGPKFAKKQLIFALEDDHPLIEENSKGNYDEHSGIKERDEEKAAKIAARKKLPREVVNCFVAAAFRRAFLQSKSNNNLYVEDPHLTREWHLLVSRKQNDPHYQEPTIKGHISLFVVDKGTPIDGSVPKQRIITDARATNARLEDLTKVEMFSVENLLQRMSFIMNNNNNNGSNVFALQCDLRHWYHQIKLPRRFRKYFRINLGNGDPQFVYPACWPMGFHMSSAIAQAATWSILLADLEAPNDHSINERRKLGIEWEGDFDSLQWLPLAGGGAIFVQTDNIFLITTNEAVKNNWRKRILKNSQDLGATLKELHPEKESMEEKVFDEQTFNKKDINNKHTISFNGIEFGRYGRQVKEIIKKDEQLHDEKSTQWKGTYRQALSIIGQILWNFRVRGERLLYKEEFMKVMSEHGFPKHITTNWDSEQTIEGENFKTLMDAYWECVNNHVNRNFAKYEKMRNQSSYGIFVSDASLERKDVENNKIGGMFYVRRRSGNKRVLPPNF